MTDIKIAFWDWNGTLWNDVDQWFLAAKAAYQHAQISSDLTLEQLRDAFDVPVQDVIYTLGAPHNLPQENHDALLKTFVATLSQHEDKASTHEGAHDVLSILKQHNIENFLISNHPLDLLQKELAKGGLLEFFRTVCGNDNHDQVYTRGTKRDRIETHLQETGVLASQTCIIADTREEIRIAREFGMMSIALTGGYNSERVLRDEKPTHLIHNLGDVGKLILR